VLKRIWKPVNGGGLLLLLVVVPGLTACGKKDQATGASPAPPAPVAAAPAAAAPTPAPAAQAPAAAAPVAAPTGLGVQEHDVGGVDVVLLEVKRTSGDTLTLKWRYRNKTSEKKVLVGFSASWFDKYRLSAETYLIDSVNKKKYLVIKDGDDHPIVATQDTQGVTLDAGQTLTTWAKFPAPPPEVPTISIFIPHVPPFEDVPIGK